MDRRTARELIERLERDAARIAEAFDLRYRVIEPERANVRRRYGVCYSDGTIRIRLRHASTGRPLKYSSLVSTLCHELAHLRHFHHGPSFQRFYASILRWARREGIYRPGAAAARTPMGSPRAAGEIPAGVLAAQRSALRGQTGPARRGVRPTAAAASTGPSRAGGPQQLGLFGDPS